MRAVVRADYRHRRRAGVEPFPKERGYLAHGGGGLYGTGGEILFRKGKESAVHVLQRISFFCDGKGNQLQGGIAENRLQALPLLRIGRVGPQRPGHRAHHCLIHAAVGHQSDQETQVIVGGIGVLDDLITPKRNNSLVLWKHRFPLALSGPFCRQDTARSPPTRQSARTEPGGNTRGGYS